MEDRKSLEDLTKHISETLSEILEESRREKEEQGKQIETLKEDQARLQSEIDSLKKELSEKEERIHSYEEERITLLKRIMEG